MKNKYKKPSSEAIAQACRIPNLTLLERVLAAELTQANWDRKVYP